MLGTGRVLASPHPVARSHPTRLARLAVPRVQRRFPGDCGASVAIDPKARVLMAAPGMGDAGEDEPQRGAVKTVHDVAEPHRG